MDLDKAILRRCLKTGDKMDFCKALESMNAGKKLRHSKLDGEWVTIETDLSGILGKTVVLTIGTNSKELGHSFDIFDVFAEDWEIVPDVQEARVLFESIEYYICPRCQNKTRLSGETYLITCNYCKSTIKLIRP